MMLVEYIGVLVEKEIDKEIDDRARYIQSRLDLRWVTQ